MRADLLALTADDLATLTNRGTVKRAAREAGDVEVREEADGTVVVEADDASVVLPAGVPLEDARCTCAAGGAVPPRRARGAGLRGDGRRGARGRRVVEPGRRDRRGPRGCSARGGAAAGADVGRPWRDGDARPLREADGAAARRRGHRPVPRPARPRLRPLRLRRPAALLTRGRRGPRLPRPGPCAGVRRGRAAADRARRPSTMRSPGAPPRPPPRRAAVPASPSAMPSSAEAASPAAGPRSRLPCAVLSRPRARTACRGPRTCVPSSPTSSSGTRPATRRSIRCASRSSWARPCCAATRSAPGRRRRCSSAARAASAETEVGGGRLVGLGTRVRHVGRSSTSTRSSTTRLPTACWRSAARSGTRTRLRRERSPTSPRRASSGRSRSRASVPGS